MGLYNQILKQDAEKKREPAVEKAAPQGVPPLSTARPVSDGGVGAGAIRFVQEVPGWMVGRLEAERARRGLRSRAETIRVLLGEALK